MTAKDAVIADAMRLSEAERLEVAQQLYESVEGPADPDAERLWAEEIERRLRSLDAGEAKLIPWEEARRRIAGDSDGPPNR